MELAEAASAAASTDRSEEQERRLGLRWRRGAGKAAHAASVTGLLVDRQAEGGDGLQGRKRKGEGDAEQREEGDAQVRGEGVRGGRRASVEPATALSSSPPSTSQSSWFLPRQPTGARPPEAVEESRVLTTESESRDIRAADVSLERNTGVALREFDIVVYGASGITGRKIVAELVRAEYRMAPTLRLAVAGRSEGRVRAALAKEALDPNAFAVIVAGNGMTESARAASLRLMAGRCRLVLNAAGPYRDSGDSVVGACVECGTDYVDVTGEPLFIERTLLRHAARAAQTGARVVQCCGFDSVPADLGVARCDAAFAAAGALLCEVESYLTVSGGGSRVRANATTFECAVRGVSDVNSLVATRKQIENAGLLPLGVEPLGGRQKVKDFVYNEALEQNATKFMGSDAAVVRRSIRVRSGETQRPRVQYAAYLTLPTLWTIFLYSFFGTIVGTLAKLGRPFRALMIRYPGFFTWGLFSRRGPTKEYLAKGTFEMRFLCRGISLEALNAGRTNVWDVSMDCTVTGPEAGYVATPIIAAACAVGLIRDAGSTFRGGVATPSIGLSGIMDPFWGRVERRGVHFKVLSMQKEGATQ